MLTLQTIIDTLLFILKSGCLVAIGAGSIVSMQKYFEVKEFREIEEKSYQRNKNVMDELFKITQKSNGETRERIREMVDELLKEINKLKK